MIYDVCTLSLSLSFSPSFTLSHSLAHLAEKWCKFLRLWLPWTPPSPRRRWHPRASRLFTQQHHLLWLGALPARKHCHLSSATEAALWSRCSTPLCLSPPGHRTAPSTATARQPHMSRLSSSSSALNTAKSWPYLCGFFRDTFYGMWTLNWNRRQVTGELCKWLSTIGGLIRHTLLLPTCSPFSPLCANPSLLNPEWHQGRKKNKEIHTHKNLRTDLKVALIPHQLFPIHKKSVAVTQVLGTYLFGSCQHALCVWLFHQSASLSPRNIGNEREREREGERQRVSERET